MYEIRKIHPWPFAKSAAIILVSAMLVIPLGVILFIAIIESQYRGFAISNFLDILIDEDFLVGYLILIPVTVAVSLAAGLLGALAYNFVARNIGGIVLEIDYKQKTDLDRSQDRIV